MRESFSFLRNLLLLGPAPAFILVSSCLHSVRVRFCSLFPISYQFHRLWFSAEIMASSESPYPSRPSIDSSAAVLSPIISPSASYVDLTSYNPPASRNSTIHRPRRRRESTASSILSLNSSVGTVVDWKSPKEYGNNGMFASSAIPVSKRLVTNVKCLRDH